MSKKKEVKKSVEKENSANIILIALTVVLLCGICGYILYLVK